MKKVLAVVCSLMLACVAAFALVGCGNDFAGNWGAVAMDDGSGSVVELSEYEELLGMTGAEMFTLTLNEDGSVSLVSFGEDITSQLGDEITWKESDEGVSLSAGDNAIDLSYDSNTGRLGLNVDGSLLYFEKIK